MLYLSQTAPELGSYNKMLPKKQGTGQTFITIIISSHDLIHICVVKKKLFQFIIMMVKLYCLCEYVS